MEGVLTPATPTYLSRLKNFSASALFVSLAFLIYRLSPHSQGLLAVRHDVLPLTGSDILTISSTGYVVLLFAFYLTEHKPRESKSVAALRALRAIAFSPKRTFQQGLPAHDRLGLLTILLKGFFAPLMVLSLFDFTGKLITHGHYLLTHSAELKANFLVIFNSHGFWFLFQVILFFDVVFFTFGYLVEHPWLKNEIRSVDPTLLGWGVALACYPPFNGIVGTIMGWGGSEFPQFANPAVHVTMNFALLGLMAIYAYASIALNVKASNLTHRGIIHHGPYKYVRHPAYVCKNAAWWIGTAPAAAAAWEISSWGALLVIGSTAGWTGIYVLRALTEEDHLHKVDSEYDAYCKKVRYRFIPGVY